VKSFPERANLRETIFKVPSSPEHVLKIEEGRKMRPSSTAARTQLLVFLHHKTFRPLVLKIVLQPGADSTIVSCDASAVKIYYVTSRPVRFKNKKAFFYSGKRSSLVRRSCKLEVVGLAVVN
jgi:hypothetical protein